MTLEGRFPDEGQAIIRWNVSIISGQGRLGWSFDTSPQLELELAQALVAKVAYEPEIDLRDNE